MLDDRFVQVAEMSPTFKEEHSWSEHFPKPLNIFFRDQDIIGVSDHAHFVVSPECFSELS